MEKSELIDLIEFEKLMLYVLNTKKKSQQTVCSARSITCCVRWQREKTREKDKALIKLSVLIFLPLCYENWIPTNEKKTENETGKKYPTELNIQQQIPLNVSMVSLLILHGCFVRCSCSRLIWSLYLFFFQSLFCVALCTQFSKYKMCNDPIRKRVPKQWCERDFHYACRCSSSSNKTNGQSTYGNQVTSKNDLIPAPNCARKDHFLAATLQLPIPIPMATANTSESITCIWSELRRFNFTLDFILFRFQC